MSILLYFYDYMIIFVEQEDRASKIRLLIKLKGDIVVLAGAFDGRRSLARV
jgi:hypothetical protein